MGTESVKREWPGELPDCKRCGVKKDYAPYAGRGLCVRCYGQERRAGTLAGWRYRADAKRAPKNTAMYACMLVGKTKVCADFGIDKDTLHEWVLEKVPRDIHRKLKKYIKRIIELSEEEQSPEREALFEQDAEPIEKEQRQTGEWSFPDW